MKMSTYVQFSNVNDNETHEKQACQSYDARVLRTHTVNI